VSVEFRLWVIAVACFFACLLLGFAVSHASGLWRLDLEAVALRGEYTPLASFFTFSGRGLPLMVLALCGVAIVAATRTNIRIAIAIVVAQVLSQGAVELMKHVFQRARPDAWLVNKELGYSYPSGHATTAALFFGSWLVFALLSPLPNALKAAVVIVLAIWMAGIDWSRMALSAHYPTDVLGGTLFGTACACALWALILHFSGRISV
jgi:membrane-associated phospholipid phosphatase